MKDEILKLRKQGKTYSQISIILKCSKSTVSYYCGIEQKEKIIARTKNRRKNILLNKTEKFKSVKKNNTERIRKFQKRDNKSKGSVNKLINLNFNWKDVLEKYGVNTHCYLSGEKINLNEDTYSLDHVIPVSKNGPNTLDNLGITTKIINSMKSDLTPNEFILMCKKVLEFNGYEVKKNN